MLHFRVRLCLGPFLGTACAVLADSVFCSGEIQELCDRSPLTTTSPFGTMVWGFLFVKTARQTSRSHPETFFVPFAIRLSRRFLCRYHFAATLTKSAGTKKSVQKGGLFLRTPVSNVCTLSQENCCFSHRQARSYGQECLSRTLSSGLYIALECRCEHMKSASTFALLSARLVTSGCIMTYGQTGSGKTFTMTGDSGNYQVTTTTLIPERKNGIRTTINNAPGCSSKSTVVQAFLESFRPPRKCQLPVPAANGRENLGLRSEHC